MEQLRPPRDAWFSARIAVRFVRQAQPALRIGLTLLAALTAALSPARADEGSPTTRHWPLRSVATRPAQAAASAPAQPREVKAPAVRMAQLASHGRYPFGQFRGGYRYPYSYPYYRYGRAGHSLYPFGVGPYGPYGSNYGGSSGNAYDPRAYGRPPSDGQALPDAPAAPPAAAVPSARVHQYAPAEIEQGPALSVQSQPAPADAQAYGEPPLYFGGSPFSPTFGSARAYGAYPFGYFGNNMWFGNHRLIQGFGNYPAQVYNYPYGPPNGPGDYSPEFAPQYYSFNARIYGPAYPTPGGFNW